jgi:hypothetical protein
VNPAPASLIEVVESHGGRTCRLPPRELGGLQGLALAPVLGVVIGSAFIAQFYLTRAAKGQLNDWIWGLLALMGLVWARVSYTFLSYAAVLLAGRAEIEVTNDGAVRAFDRAGWFRVRWGKLGPGTTQRLVLKPLLALKDASGRPLPIRLWQLTAQSVRGRTVWLAPGYPRAVLAELADLLARQLAVAPPDAEPAASAGPTPAGTPAPVPVVVEEPEVPSRDVLEQPRESRVVTERHPDGVTMTVPALGLGKATGGLIIMSLFFMGIGGIFLISTLVALFQPNPKMPIGAVIPGALFFVLGGILFVGSLNAGLKKVVLAVVRDRLFTFETGLFGSRRREFLRASLLDIACGPSNITVNKKPLHQIQIVALDRTRTGLLTGRDETELRWIATVLRQALGMPSEPPQFQKRNPWMGTSEIRDPHAGS